MNTKRQPTELLTPAAIAGELKVSARYVRLWIRVGTLPATRLGPRTQRVTRADLEAFLRRFKMAGR